MVSPSQIFLVLVSGDMYFMVSPSQIFFGPVSGDMYFMVSPSQIFFGPVSGDMYFMVSPSKVFVVPVSGEMYFVVSPSQIFLVPLVSGDMHFVSDEKTYNLTTRIYTDWLFYPCTVWLLFGRIVAMCTRPLQRSYPYHLINPHTGSYTVDI